MHLRALFVLGLTIFSSLNSAQAAIEDNIIDLLEEFRVRMCHPFPKTGIPALDPFEIDHKEIYLNNDIFKDFFASVTDLRLTGLSDFIINKIKITTLTQKFTVDLTFPLTTLESQYKAQGSLGYIVNLIGDDKLIGRVTEFRIIITGGLKIGTSVGIKNLKIQFHINDIFVDLGRLMEHDRLNNFVNNLLNDLTVELLNDFWTDYGEFYTKKVELFINKALTGYTLKDILAIIGGSGEPVFGDDPPGDCKDPIVGEKISLTKDSILTLLQSSSKIQSSVRMSERQPNLV